MYEWLAASDVTSSMMGAPTFPEAAPPTWAEFCVDYGPNFFDASTPEFAGSYIIEVCGEAVGQVNYEIDHGLGRAVELDIWLRSEADCGHGYGPDALRTLAQHLRNTIDAAEFVIRPSKRNPRAIHAYQKAGFVLVPMTMQEQIASYGPGDYADAVVLRKGLLTG
jgi:RimJ/RimL family protein N-acetyltransferase